MTIVPRPAHVTVVVATLSIALAACGGDTTDAAGLPTAEDLGVGEGQPLDPVEEPVGAGDDAPVTSGMCAAEQPDCQDTIDSSICAPSSTEGCDDVEVQPADPAAGSCLAGDPDCTDESYGGQDVARPVPLSSEPSGAEPAARGATSGATAHRIEHAHLVDPDTLEVTIGDNPCMLVEDVLVEESPDEVRVLVLAGQDASVDGCIEPYVPFTVQIDLSQPMGERTLLDLAG